MARPRGLALTQREAAPHPSPWLGPQCPRRAGELPPPPSPSTGATATAHSALTCCYVTTLSNTVLLFKQTQRHRQWSHKAPGSLASKRRLG